MARRDEAIADQVLDTPEASVLDVLDHVLAKGVMASGDVTLGVAGIDLIYLRLSAILCAADRVLAPRPERAPEPKPKSKPESKSRLAPKSKRRYRSARRQR